MILKLKKGEIRYVKETHNDGEITYYKFKGTRFWVWKDHKWKLGGKCKIERFTWSNKIGFVAWKNEYITEKELFIELL